MTNLTLQQTNAIQSIELALLVSSIKKEIKRTKNIYTISNQKLNVLATPKKEKTRKFKYLAKNNKSLIESTTEVEMGFLNYYQQMYEHYYENEYFSYNTESLFS